MMVHIVALHDKNVHKHNKVKMQALANSRGEFRTFLSTWDKSFCENSFAKSFILDDKVLNMSLDCANNDILNALLNSLQQCFNPFYFSFKSFCWTYLHFPLSFGVLLYRSILLVTCISREMKISYCKCDFHKAKKHTLFRYNSSIFRTKTSIYDGAFLQK